MESKRIFGVGLSRTGTTSLHAAAVILGFSSIHYPMRLAPSWMAGNFSTETIGPFDVLSDLPVPTYFREFDRICPDSKFILTQRDAEQWIESVDRWYRTMPPSSPRTVQRDVIRLICFGVHNFHRQRFMDVFQRHSDDVLEYFLDRPNDLLVLDLTSETNAWNPLCRFLGRQVPDRSFPHLKTPAIGDLQSVSAEEMTEKGRRMIELADRDTIEPGNPRG